jgi:glycosyltransferase involved in cell wall biosynthesis
VRVIITPYFRSNPYSQLLAQSLEEIGVEVILYQPGPFLPLWQAVHKHGKPDIIHLQRQHTFFRKNTIFFTFLSTFAFWIQWLTLRMIGVKFVWTVHNLVNHEKHWSKWELFWSRMLAHSVDGVVVHCQAAVPIVAEAYDIDPEHIWVTPLGHYAGWYSPAVTKQEARQKLGLPVTGRVLLFFGLVRDYKGVDILIKAFKELEETDIALFLVGQPQPPALAETLVGQIAADKRIRANLEFVSDDLLVRYLSACDLVVLPYRDILTSSAIMMAASYGRPIVTPRIACMGEIPPDAGILYDPNECEESKPLLEALQKALVMPLEEMGYAAKAYADQFPWFLTAQKTKALYLWLLREKEFHNIPSVQ